MLKLSNPDIAASRGALGPGDPRISTRAAALGALPQPQEPLPVPPPRYGRTGATYSRRAHRSLSSAHARPALRRVNAPRERFRGGDLAHAHREAAGRPQLSTRRSRHRLLPAWRPRSVALPWERGAGRREDGGRAFGAVALLLLGSVGSLPARCSARRYPHVFQSPCKI